MTNKSTVERQTELERIADVWPKQESYDEYRAKAEKKKPGQRRPGRPNRQPQAAAAAEERARNPPPEFNAILSTSTPAETLPCWGCSTRRCFRSDNFARKSSSRLDLETPAAANGCRFRTWRRQPHINPRSAPTTALGKPPQAQVSQQWKRRALRRARQRQDGQQDEVSGKAPANEAKQTLKMDLDFGSALS